MQKVLVMGKYDEGARFVTERYPDFDKVNTWQGK